MANTENKPPKQSSMGYSIQFDPDKQWQRAEIPKCVKEYTTKPCLSVGQLMEKQEKAFSRKKFEEQSRIERIHEREKTAVSFDKKVRPYLEQLQKSGANN